MFILNWSFSSGGAQDTCVIFEISFLKEHDLPISMHRKLSTYGRKPALMDLWLNSNAKQTRRDRGMVRLLKRIQKYYQSM